MNDLNECPGCGGPADNGYDRCVPPTAYYCTKCSLIYETERQAIERIGDEIDVLKTKQVWHEAQIKVFKKEKEEIEKVLKTLVAENNKMREALIRIRDGDDIMITGLAGTDDIKLSWLGGKEVVEICEQALGEDK